MFNSEIVILKKDTIT